MFFLFKSINESEVVKIDNSSNNNNTKVSRVDDVSNDNMLEITGFKEKEIRDIRDCTMEEILNFNCRK